MEIGLDKRTGNADNEGKMETRKDINSHTEGRTMERNNENKEWVIDSAGDGNVWRSLTALPGGYVPQVKRTYRHKGMVVELSYKHPHIDGCYRPRAVYAHNVAFCPEWVWVSDLVALD